MLKIMTHTIYRNFLGRWFGKVTKVVISETGLTLLDLSKKNKAILLTDLVDFPLIEKTIFGNTLIIKATIDNRVEVSKIWGISADSARIFEQEAKTVLNKIIAKNIASQLDTFYKKAIFQYLRDSSVTELNIAVTPFIQSYRESTARWGKILSKAQLSKIDVISRMPSIKNAESYRHYFESKILEEYADFFDNVESNPLTKEQRLAVVRNNDKNLSLAAAGTGKTSVIVAKALYLINHDEVPVENVLILAYNNAAAKELKERLEDRKKACGLSCPSPIIMTFHALALKILKEVEANTALSVLANDSKQLEHWLHTWLEAHISQSTTAMKQFLNLVFQPSNTFNDNPQLAHEADISDLMTNNTKDIIARLSASGILTKTIKTLIKCLQAIRVEQLSAEQITNRLDSGKIHNSKQYAYLLNEIAQAYAAELKFQEKIDFDDMITNAFTHIHLGQYLPQWTDILVDEFQDISSARMKLLDELINKGPTPRLTAVGDDWQSIYRFSGAKLALITQFDSYSGSHSLTTLQKTFRYNNSIAETAGKFVMQNPQQYIKQIESHHQVDNSQVYLVDTDKSTIDNCIKVIVSTIKRNDPTATIAVLARYRYLLNEASDKLANISDNCNINYWTFHSAKGLEADYCIMLGFFKGKLGFPSENKDDVVVEALLPLVDGFQYSEERRLLYVAMTRAKKKSYLIADSIAPSEFIEELSSQIYDVRSLPKQAETWNEAIENSF